MKVKEFLKTIGPEDFDKEMLFNDSEYLYNLDEMEDGGDVLIFASKVLTEEEAAEMDEEATTEEEPQAEGETE